MSGDFNKVEKFIEEILIDLMTEKVMFIGVQASSTRGVQASPSTSHGFGPSRAAIEK
jgi:predicted secreted protein